MATDCGQLWLMVYNDGLEGLMFSPTFAFGHSDRAAVFSELHARR